MTGTLEGYDRVGIKETIERFGGKASSSVSKKTTWLLAGAEPGDKKVEKARELGIPFLTEAEFNALIAGDAKEPAEPDETTETSETSADETPPSAPPGFLF